MDVTTARGVGAIPRPVSSGLLSGSQPCRILARIISEELKRGAHRYAGVVGRALGGASYDG